MWITEIGWATGGTPPALVVSARAAGDLPPKKTYK